MAGKKKDTSSKLSTLQKAARNTRNEIKKYSHKIWLAGLGAYAKVEEEGEKTFDRLVELGQEFEDKSSKETNAEPSKESETTQHESRLGDIKSKANQTMDKIEKAFDERLTSALNRLGLGSKNDIDELSDRIDELTKSIEALAKKDKK